MCPSHVTFYDCGDKNAYSAQTLSETKIKFVTKTKQSLNCFETLESIFPSFRSDLEFFNKADEIGNVLILDKSIMSFRRYRLHFLHGSHELSILKESLIRPWVWFWGLIRNRWPFQSPGWDFIIIGGSGQGKKLSHLFWCRQGTILSFSNLFC